MLTLDDDKVVTGKRNLTGATCLLNLGLDAKPSKSRAEHQQHRICSKHSQSATSTDTKHSAILSLCMFVLLTTNQRFVTYHSGTHHLVDTTAFLNPAKKRKLGKDNDNTNHNYISSPASVRDKASLTGSDRASSSHSASSSPRYLSSRGSSPVTSVQTRSLPSQIIAGAREAGGDSPSGAFAAISIDGPESMSGSEHGRDIHTTEEPASVRSASPAKRTAREMEGNTQLPSPRSDTARDGLAQDITNSVAASIENDDHMNMQADSAPSSKTVSLADTLATSNTAATSLETHQSSSQTDHAAGIPSLDEQVRKVRELTDKPLEAGDRGVVISSSWLARVLARTSENVSNLTFPKEAREGDIGPFDNSDIVPAAAFSEPLLKDSHDASFVPLKPGLGMGNDIEVLPHEAYGLIVGWHGIVRGQKAIIRYAVDTAPQDASQSNIQYELYPPIFTIRKVPFSSVNGGDTVKDKSRQSVIALKERMERKSRGQVSPDDALRITKVKTWRSLKPAAVQPTTNNDTESVSAPLKLTVDASTWDKLESGKDIEEIDVKDQSSDENYNGSSTMEVFSLFDDQVLILEEQQPSSNDQKIATFSTKIATPQSANTSRRNSPAPRTGMTTRGRTLRNGRTRGTVGLQNLGNTCYMNSALQCIRSVEELAVYFLENKHKQEINAGNPLGYKGSVATRYAEVIRAIYNESAGSSYSPTAFKRLLGQVMPTFSGFGQQDSQEYLSFLVDALHEDLNRIEKKPYFENPDSDDARVNDPAYLIELGETYRSNHRARNDSIAMDLFSGFYKNTMECPTCDKISVTFDPYSLLTLQLPVTNTVTHAFIYVPLNGNPVVHDLDIEKNATIMDLKLLIATKHEDVDASKLWVAEVYSHKLYKVFADSTTFGESGISGKDNIFVFQLEYNQHILQKKNESSDLAEIDDSENEDEGMLESDEIESEATNAAPVSDHSVPSEDEYVNITVDGTAESKDEPSNTSSNDDSMNANGRFMDHTISKKLKNQLFQIKYCRASGNGHSTGLQTADDKNLHLMRQRVSLDSRRSSLDSASLTEATTSEPATPSLVDNIEESDQDETVDESTTAESIPADTEVESMNGEAIMSNARSGRRKGGKHNKFDKSKKKRDKTYSKRDKRMQRKAKQDESSVGKIRSILGGSKQDEEEDNEYYIKIGECIVLDWYEESFDELFGGNALKPDDTRGHWLSSTDGTGLTVYDDPVVQAKRAKRQQRNKFGVSLEDCFAETGKREKLSADNAWYCGRCKELRQATKTLEVWTLPDILVLHLKRFGGNRRFNDKIDIMVDYPVEGLDLADRVGLKEEGKSYVYDLFAVDNHYGGLGGGHYTAVAKNFFDRECCSRQGDAPRRSAAAYLLFYRRRSDKPLGPPAIQELVLKYRNPSSMNDSANEDGEESDSGEGRLDGLSSTLRGSSSGIGAGVAAMRVGNNSQRSGQTVQDDAGLSGLADKGRTQKRRVIRSDDEDEDEGISMLPSDTRQASQMVVYKQPAEWSFDNVDRAIADDSDTMLLDDDNLSLVAHNESPEGDHDNMDDEFADAAELPAENQWNATETSFSLGPSYGENDALHLEDAGMIDEGIVEDESPPAVDIQLDGNCYAGPADFCHNLVKNMSVFIRVLHRPADWHCSTLSDQYQGEHLHDFVKTIMSTIHIACRDAYGEASRPWTDLLEQIASFLSASMLEHQLLETISGIT
ncbi:hypothetical protein MRB53_042184 [Persea americana]|nr:hypothetical protein MRB53_042184 [Persea americana]